MIKRLIIVFICILSIIPVQLHARKYYCEIKGIGKNFSSVFKITIDFWENSKYSIGIGVIDSKDLVTEGGESVEFKSMVDTENYMEEKGCNFQQTYSSFYGGTAVYNWIFYKEAETKEEAGKGIMTKETYKVKK